MPGRVLEKHGRSFCVIRLSCLQGTIIFRLKKYQDGAALKKTSSKWSEQAYTTIAKTIILCKVDQWVVYHTSIAEYFCCNARIFFLLSWSFASNASSICWTRLSKWVLGDVGSCPLVSPTSCSPLSLLLARIRAEREFGNLLWMTFSSSLTCCSKAWIFLALAARVLLTDFSSVVPGSWNNHIQQVDRFR